MTRSSLRMEGHDHISAEYWRADATGIHRFDNAYTSSFPGDPEVQRRRDHHGRGHGRRSSAGMGP